MGTLTADVTRLPEYCEHKLPTSCRLTSIPNCCACADERAHAASYSTYIDGIGFVPRGNRWQRYCWFCKEFWEERVRVSGLRPGQTKIPEVPDQSAFLQKWYEFHRGYRIVKKDDGTEERIAVLGEDFKDVSPGHLPRTVEELRDGRRREEEVQQLPQSHEAQTENTGPTLEDTLEQMFEDAAAEEATTSSVPRSRSGEQSFLPPHASLERQTVVNRPTELIAANNLHAQAMNSAPSRNREYQARRVAALRRELNRMRTGIERVIEGLRELGEEIPDSPVVTTDASSSLARLGSTLNTIADTAAYEPREQGAGGSDVAATSAGSRPSDRTLANMQERISEARTQVNEARRARDHASSDLSNAEAEYRTRQQRLQQLQREQRTAENYMRLFGTREEMIAQGDNYESPIGGMFSRAYERFRAAERARAEERTLREVLAQENAQGGEYMARRVAELENRDRDVWGVPWSPSTSSAGATATSDIPASARELPFTGQDNESDTPPVLMATSDENMLQEYYAMIRARDRGDDRPDDRTSARDTPQQPGEASAAELPGDNFPANMLNAIRAARQQELAEINSTAGRSGPTVSDTNFNEAQSSPFSVDQWVHEDAHHIIRAMTTDEALRDELGIAPQGASVLLSYFINDVVSDADRLTIDGLLRNPIAIWGSRLPAEWLRRRREQVFEPSLVGQLLFSQTDESTSDDWNQHHNWYLTFEILAQAYQMSAEVRRATDLTPPERLQMLYRLQSGQRTEGDIASLQSLYSIPASYLMAMTTYQRTLARNQDSDSGDWALRAEIDASRRRAARDGNHSLSELDNRRHETANAFALAAGRQAMQTGSTTLLQQAISSRSTANLDEPDIEGTRAAMRRLHLTRPLRTAPRLYRQLTLSDYLNEASSDTDTERDEDTEPRGLDAMDSGRPEPKEDEDLTVSMECKICYTQLAEVACLPCGHLVMCRWCSEQHSPVMQHDRTRPRRAAGCPVCRKGVRQKVRVFRA